MNLQRLLERLLGSPAKPRSADPPAVVAPPAAEDAAETGLPRLDRLDLQAAIIHHLEWCVLFNEHLTVAPTQAQHATPLPDAQDSALGQWLATMSQRPAGQHPVFTELQREHQRFHGLARRALDHARHQRMDLASTLLNTEFERSRARILEMLRRMQKR
jgi:hypothetical protein